MEIDASEFLLKTFLAIVSGFLLGLERQIKDKPAGLKTNTLVSLGAAVFILISMEFKAMENTDLTRVIGQVVVGVGFLGAGTIMRKKDKRNVSGLATAATIWCSAGSGSLAAVGAYVPLLLFTLMVVGINVLFGYLNHKIDHK